MQSSEPRFELLDVETRNVLGEGPWWCASSGHLWWVDILARRVHRSDLNGHKPAVWSAPEDVGFAVLNVDGLVALGLRSGLSWLDPVDGTVRTGPRVEAERDDHRINDGKTDHRGRLWFGTMHDPETEPTSSFYRCDERGLARVLDRVTTSNGLGWSPDDRILYHTDSMTRRIDAYEFDPDDGTLGEKRVFASDPDAYLPDGLTVDTDGCVWSAKWNGGKVVRYTPDGRVDRELHLPVSRPTSCMFVGRDLRTLAVTSAQPGGHQPAVEELAGAVFLLDVLAQGLTEHPTTIGPDMFHVPRGQRESPQ